MPDAGRDKTLTATQRERIIPILLFALVVCVSIVAWRQPVTSMPMNRNDASCYLLLAHNLVEHGVYSLDQTAPFRPHTEWPPGIPLLYTLPVALAGGFPLDDAAWIVRLFAWLVAAGSLWSVFRYVRLFCEAPVAWLVTLCTLGSRAFLDETQAAFADVPALGAMFLILFEIEHHFRSRTTSSWRSVAMFLGMALLPLIKPYLGVVYVAYLWHLTRRWWVARREATAELHPHRRLAAGIGLTTICCLPFVGFMAYSVIAAEATGTISAVTWLVTDNPVDVREGVAKTDPKSMSEWLNEGVTTLKYHLIYHVTASPVPLLEMVNFRDWPVLPRLTLILCGGVLIALGAIRLTLRGSGAAVSTTFSMLAVFTLLACDGARYFVILTPLFAWLYFSGVEALAGLCAGCRSTRQWTASTRGRIAVRRTAFALAAVSAVVWATERTRFVLDSDPLYDEVYSVLFELRDRDDVSTIVVPFPLRELAVVETDKRVLVYGDVDSLAAGPNGDPDSTAILWFNQSVVRNRDGFSPPESLKLLISQQTHLAEQQSSLVTVVLRGTPSDRRGQRSAEFSRKTKVRS